MAPKSTLFSKSSRALRWRQQSMLSRPNKKSMVEISNQPCLWGQNGHKEMHFNAICLHKKTRSQPARPKVAVFTGKIDCKKYPRALQNLMTKEKQIHVRKMQQEQGIKPIFRPASAEARVASLEAKLGINYQPE